MSCPNKELSDNEVEVKIKGTDKVKVKNTAGRKPTRGTEYKGDQQPFKTRTRSNTSLYEVWAEKGVIPKVLRGLYSTPEQAQKAIKEYESTRRLYY